MSRLRADSISNRLGTGAPTFPDGIIVSAAATFSSNVSIAGTLTYEDVTNVDSIGLVTARSGIQVLAGGINAVGVVTASSLSVGGRIVSTLGVGINTSGGNVGYGATLLDFRGSGISTVTVSSGIATINVAGGGGVAFNPISFVMSL